MEVAVEPDVREIAAREPARVGEDVVRVPSADEISVALDDARRALAEVTARQSSTTRKTPNSAPQNWCAGTPTTTASRKNAAPATSTPTPRLGDRISLR
jgi:hypothetical protein